MCVDVPVPALPVSEFIRAGVCYMATCMAGLIAYGGSRDNVAMNAGIAHTNETSILIGERRICDYAESTGGRWVSVIISA